MHRDCNYQEDVELIHWACGCQGGRWGACGEGDVEADASGFDFTAENNKVLQPQLPDGPQPPLGPQNNLLTDFIKM